MPEKFESHVLRMGISKFLPEPFVHISYTVFVQTPLKECMEI
jgi:hypothetical protein